MKKFITVLMTISITLIFVTTALADLNDGLVAYYPFNGNANDESSNGNDGTVYGATLAEDRFCNADSAYSFDGNADSIEIPYTLINDLLDVTFSGWIKTGDNLAGILSGANSTAAAANEYLIHAREGIVEFYIKGIDPPVSSVSTINDDVWHHLGLVRVGSSGEVKIFIDGQLDNSGSMPTGNLVIELGGLWFGREQDCVGNCWFPSQDLNGTLDDVRIYDRALSESEIQELYNETPLPLERPEPTVEMVIDKMEINLEDGKFEIKGYLDTTDPDFENLVLDPRSRLLFELQTDGTEDDPEFGVVGKDQIQLTTDDDWEELKFESEEE